MIYLKSFLVGLVTVIFAAILAALTIATILAIKGRNLPPGQAIGWDPVSLFRNSLVAWVVLVLVFVIGFAWEYRRVVAHH